MSEDKKEPKNEPRLNPWQNDQIRTTESLEQKSIKENKNGEIRKNT